ncbi:MAG: hypothetical protein ACXVEE_05970 [Polyangiales bacterium]
MRMALVVVLSSACNRNPTVVSDDPAPVVKTKVKTKPRALLERYPIHKRVSYQTREEIDGKVTLTKVEETWTLIGDDALLWNCLRRELDGEKFESTTRYRMSEAGLVYDEFSVGGTSKPITPPKLELPNDAHPGSTWSAEHGSGADRQTRSCSIAELTTCDDGIVVTCVTKNGAGRVITVKNRYCGGLGFVGGEGTVVKPDGTIIKTFDENVKASN